MSARTEALAALSRRYPEDYQRILTAIKSGQPIDEVTVAEWAEQWLKMRERIVRPGTFCADQTAIRKWIVPTIGDRHIAGLQRADIREVHQATEAAGLADSTVQRIHIVLKKLLGDALEEGFDVPERTLRTGKPGGPGVSPRQALPLEDARAILEVAMERPDASRWVAALLQGMRPAEALGLRWSSLDLDRGLMTVEWQLKTLPYKVQRDPRYGFRTPRGFEAIRLTGAHHLVRPKTSSGVRVVPLVPWLKTELAAWAAIAPQSPHDLVWSRNGEPIVPGTDRAEWRSIAKAAGVTVRLADGTERLPLLYEARHTAATLLMANGADETVLTSILGHSKIASTKAYLHSDQAMKLSALEAVSEKLGVVL